MILLMLFLGLLSVLAGGGLFVDSALGLSERTGIPNVIIGATVVSLATTMPEMLVSFVAALHGNIDISIGNAIGSASANMGLILAVSAIFLPITASRRHIFVKTAAMLSSTLIILLFGLTGELGVLACVLLFICFLVFMADTVLSAVSSFRAEAVGGGDRPPFPEKNTASERRTESLPAQIGRFLSGAVLILIGSRLLVDNGSRLAEALNVPERVIAVTLIAVGTSLPELVTAVSSILKKHSDLSVGNIIGANIVNLSLVQPVSAVLSGKPLPVSDGLARFDAPVCLLIGCTAFLPMLFKERLYRRQGILLLSLYCIYLIAACKT